jgi:hypothetical protein
LCIEQQCQQLFFALTAGLNYVVTIADCTNACQQCPGPSEQCYLRIDEVYWSWYKNRFGKDVNPHAQVVPVLKAFQGHPKAGRLWENHIVGILHSFEFRSTTHERNLYRGTVDSNDVLICCQVDDFAIASQENSTAAKLIAAINEQVTTEDKGMGVIHEHAGIVSCYNGVHIAQTRDYVKLHCES